MFSLWASSNHYSSGPDRRVGQRREQAAYGAAIVTAIEASDPHARVVYGGDLNVFPRPDDPIATAANPAPSDQLAPLYEAGLRNLWDDLLADTPSSAYSYSFQGQAQTLDHLLVNDALHTDLVHPDGSGGEDIVIWQQFLTRTGLTDACDALSCADPGAIDKIAFRSGGDVELDAVSHDNPTERFTSPTGEDLSDHPPLVVRFAWGRAS